MGGESQIVVWNGTNEEPLTVPSALMKRVNDWSRDGKDLLITQQASDPHPSEIWLLSAAPVSGGEPASRKIISDPAYFLDQARISPDGQWIVYEAIPRLADQTRVQTIHHARIGRAADSNHRWQVLGRQAALVRGWKDHLFSFWP